MQNYKILCLCPPYGRNIIIIFRCEFLWSWVTLSPNTKLFCSTAPFVSPGLSAGLPYISFHTSSPATTLTSPMVIVREVLQENKQISLFCLQKSIFSILPITIGHWVFKQYRRQINSFSRLVCHCICSYSSSFFPLSVKDRDFSFYKCQVIKDPWGNIILNYYILSTLGFKIICSEWFYFWSRHTHQLKDMSTFIGSFLLYQ